MMGFLSIWSWFVAYLALERQLFGNGQGRF
jgi:hypothetical protein